MVHAGRSVVIFLFYVGNVKLQVMLSFSSIYHLVCLWVSVLPIAMFFAAFFISLHQSNYIYISYYYVHS